MSERASSVPADTLFKFPFYSIRNITSPEDKEKGRKVYVGQTPLSSILNLSTSENVREFLPETRKRKQYTQVHNAIEETLQRNPEDFSILNSGVTIVARDCDIKDDARAFLTGASIINGAQTQGVIKRFYEAGKRQENWENPAKEPHIKFELIITDDENLIAEVTIARNYQNDVKALSIAGKRGYFVELNECFQRAHPGWELSTSETEMPYEDDRVADTLRLLQVIAALVPEALWVKGGEVNKVYTYSQKARCLKDFEDIYRIVHENQSHDQYDKYRDLYQFYLDIVGQAHTLYRHWQTNQKFIGTRIHSIKRSEDGRTVLNVPDGIIFPILASLAAFAEKENGRWVIGTSSYYDLDQELIDRAASDYKTVADSNPNVMGKSRSCYSTLLQMATIIRRGEELLKKNMPAAA